MELIEKYNVPGPRYTSYPTVPYWDNPPDEAQWRELVKASFQTHNDVEGISLYIHLPFCESLCTFCGCTTRITINHKVEDPYIEALLAEWKLYTTLFESTAKIKEIHLGGGTPTFFSIENLSRLINGIRHSAQMDEHAELSFEANPNSTTTAHLQGLFDLGFRRLSLGIQDFDATVQKAINRVQTFAQVKHVTDQARRIGYKSINYDLVYGLPFQTHKSVETTIDQVNLLRPDRIAFYSYAHVPWIKPGQRSFTEMDLPTAAQKQHMYALGKKMLVNAGYLEIGMDHFALPYEDLALAYRSGKLHRNFMGYTTLSGKLLIGLGVSAISDTWTAFAQNVKVVERYQELVKSGRFPIFRGHRLNEDDLVIRKIILDIMCQFKAELDPLDRDTEKAAQNALHELELDGLVRLNQNALLVTKNGRPYVRNVCMAFDKRLHNARPDTQIFSMTV